MKMSSLAVSSSHSNETTKAISKWTASRIREWIHLKCSTRSRPRAHLNPAVKFIGLPGHRAARPFDCTGNWL